MIKIPDNGALLFHPSFIDPDDPEGLWWCKDAEDAAARSINAVSKSLTAKWRDVGAWSEWVGQFTYIFVAMPDGPERDEVLEELSDRFPVPILAPSAKSFRGMHSLCEIRNEYGLKGFDRLMLEADEMPTKGLLNVADIKVSREKDESRVCSGLQMLDREIGGFYGGEVTIWTGKRGEGKSTAAGEILLEAVEQGHAVCAYSGELPKEDFKASLLQQAAGPTFCEGETDDRSGKTIYRAADCYVPYIDQWWDHKLFLTDIQSKNAHDEDTIMRVFEYAYRKYGVDTFLVDNIMTAELKEEARIGFWRAQSAFVGRLVAFAKRLNVHVHLVAHPRKTAGSLSADDVGGSSDITNRADNVIKVERQDDEEGGYSTLITVLKNRKYGARCAVPLCYDEVSRRLYQQGGNPYRKYAWEELAKSGMQ